MARRKVYFAHFFACFLGSFSHPLVASEIGELFSAEKSTIADMANFSDLPVDHDENLLLRISKDAFGQEFLLSGSIIPQGIAATSTALTGRIVRFEKFHDAVDIYDATGGSVVTDDLPSRFLLAKLPILKEEGDHVTVDFNAGMRKVFTVEWWRTSDMFDPSERETVAEFDESRVFEIGARGERLLIKQIAGVKTILQNRTVVHAQNEIRYYLSLYKNTGFVGREADLNNRYARFFTSPAKLEPTTGRSYAYNALFDVREPIKFYYSSNTPKEYIAAVKAGIEYWNLAFDEPIVQALPAPDGLSSPDPDHNIIQWVPWDNAGFAYADLNIDPRTGQSLHGQVYMTSVFAISSVRKARSLLRQLNAEGSSQPKLQGVGVDILKSGALCHYNMLDQRKAFIASLEDLLRRDFIEDSAILEYSKNYIAGVIAHEVGHVLGLRHNFAGSLASNMTPQQRQAWSTGFLKDPSAAVTDGLISSSSVMEYQGDFDEVLTGKKIIDGKEILPHDRAAIRFGYFGETEVEDEKMLFCTDDHLFQWVDCVPFDSGSEAIPTLVKNVHETIERLPHHLIEQFIAAKTAVQAKDRRPLDSLNLKVDLYAESLFSELPILGLWFSGKARSLIVERPYGYIGDLNRVQVDQDFWRMIVHQVEEVKGVFPIFFGYLPDDLREVAMAQSSDFGISIDQGEIPMISAQKWMADFNHALDGKSYQEFVGLDGHTHHFTPDEKETMQEVAQKFFAELEKSSIKSYFKALSNLKLKYPTNSEEWMHDEDIFFQIEKTVGGLASHVISNLPEERSDATFIQGKVRDSYRMIKDFKYNWEAREGAADLLTRKDFGSYSFWAKSHQKKARLSIEGYVRSSLDLSDDSAFDAIDPDMFSRSIHAWFDRQKKIHTALLHGK